VLQLVGGERDEIRAAGPGCAHQAAREALPFHMLLNRKCLAHADGRSSRGVYDKAEYEVQRRHMMQEWSDIIDAWVTGKKRMPVLIPPSMPLFEPDPALEPGVTAM
jgi:hypothetical protein